MINPFYFVAVGQGNSACFVACFLLLSRRCALPAALKTRGPNRTWLQRNFFCNAHLSLVSCIKHNEVSLERVSNLDAQESNLKFMF